MQRNDGRSNFRTAAVRVRVTVISLHWSLFEESFLHFVRFTLQDISQTVFVNKVERDRREKELPETLDHCSAGTSFFRVQVGTFLGCLIGFIVGIIQTIPVDKGTPAVKRHWLDFSNLFTMEFSAL